MTTTTNTPTKKMSGISSAHVGLLNDLLQLNRDSAEGFTKAAEMAKSPKLKAILEGARVERTAAARAIEPLVRAAGGTPEKELSVSGSLHRTWMKVRETLSPNGDKALILEVERAEDEMKEAYTNAMSTQLPPPIADVITAQSKQVFKVHDVFSDLKHGRTSL
jgi:uncharacterized protein (TIGR02284 family)